MTLSNQLGKIFVATVICCYGASLVSAQAPAQPSAAASAAPKTAAAPKSAAPAKTSAKPAAKTAAKPAKATKLAGAAPQSVKAQPAQAPNAAPNSTPNATAGAPSDAVAQETSKRDPFISLVDVRKEGGSPEHLPPGKAGLVVATVRIDGTSSSPNGMIAVVSNPEQHVYFLHEGDHLYDGDVEKISADGVTFHEVSKDAFGKAVERTVTKRIYPSAGE